jgi:hypothetical protein
MSLVETKDAVDLTKYKTWASYDSRDLNIEGMFRMLGGR